MSKVSQIYFQEILKLQNFEYEIIRNFHTMLRWYVDRFHSDIGPTYIFCKINFMTQCTTTVSAPHEAKIR
jgi:hypothetical protein